MCARVRRHEAERQGPAWQQGPSVAMHSRWNQPFAHRCAEQQVSSTRHHSTAQRDPHPTNKRTVFFLLAAAASAGLALLDSRVAPAVRRFPLLAFSFARSKPPCPVPVLPSSPLLLSPAPPPPPLAAAAGASSASLLLLSSDVP